MFASIKQVIQETMADLFSGEGAPKQSQSTPQENAPESDEPETIRLPCNYYSEF